MKNFINRNIKILNFIIPMVLLVLGFILYCFLVVLCIVVLPINIIIVYFTGIWLPNYYWKYMREDYIDKEIFPLLDYFEIPNI